MENCKLYIVEMPEDLMGKEVSSNMKIWLRTIFEKMSNEATLWLGFNFLYYSKVMAWLKEIGFVNHLDNWMIVEDEEGKRHDYFHLTKKATGYTWNKVEFKREVVVPYMVDGKPRGWFRGPDGRPLRFTGIGNCTYASKINNKYSFSDLVFILSSSNKGDIVDIQNPDSFFMARALDRKLKDKDTLNDFNPGEELKETIKAIVGEY